MAARPGGRVIAGAARGTHLAAAGEGTRPLSDRVKEALFAALEAEGAVREGSVFLDLFAGSGAAGIEALSRGATRAVFVERDKTALRVIEDNLRRTHQARGSVLRDDALRFLATPAAAHGAPFDCVVVDPPYDSDLLVPALELLADRARGWLSEDAVVVAKHFWRDAPAPLIGGLERYRERRFGETTLSFYSQPRESSRAEDG